MTDQIQIRGARLHNLKNISVSIPKNKIVVLTGLSGSGKSTIGFDILLHEGQRQYMESLGMAAMGVAKPPVDSITGLSPSISVDQHLTNRSPRSTVGTTTDLYTYLRILFARLGHRPCPHCGKDVPPFFGAANAEWEADEDSGAGETFPCPHCGSPVPVLTMAHFSFNKPEGACPICTGLGTVHQVNLNQLINEEKSLAEGGVTNWITWHIDYNLPVLRAAAQHYGFDFDLTRPIKEYTQAQRDLLLFGVGSPLFQRHFPGKKPPQMVRDGYFEGVATNLLRRYAEHIHQHISEAGYQDRLEEYLVTQVCPDCQGARLKAESRAVTLSGQNIIAAASLSIAEIGGWLKAIEAQLSPDEILIAEAAIHELEERIVRLVDVGAGYLTLERSTPTLSAGESQRLRLASLLGSGLSGVLYVFDEPTIGLHQRDTRRMIEVLRRLRDLGNTILVIEHDLETIAAADYVIDIGPGAGKHGGRIMAAGSPQEVMRSPASLTGAYLSGREAIPVPAQRRSAQGRGIIIRGARQHNLQDIEVRFPLGVLTAVTGVSGSGKSSLVFDILDKAIRQKLYRAGEQPGLHDSIEGLDQLDKIITIDQEHIGRIPRSNAATYTDTFTAIRSTFAATPAAKARGLTAKHFSFNVAGGRCERCEGAGMLTVHMQLLPDVEVRCPVCHGRRFKNETLEVRYRGFDISQVLDMTVEEALDLFKDVPAARSRLQVLNDVGLGYLQLGQPATTLSGGEAQRIKLSKELGRKITGRTLYLLDEPTTGLHLDDTLRLLGVLHRLVEAGNTVIVVEHNLDVIKAADWVIDLGPEGGAGGGKLIAAGTPETVAQVEASYTGRYLKEIL